MIEVETKIFQDMITGMYALRKALESLLESHKALIQDVNALKERVDELEKPMKEGWMQ